MNAVAALKPADLWRHFATLCSFPRPSKHEAALRNHLRDWALGRGLVAELDEAGNLLIRKPASKGMEDRVGVVLQGHLDMVTQQNEGRGHDFHRDPIRTRLVDGWVHADGTTLGADNGIGVAAALALLESNDVPHGPLEVLLTIDEEAGMSGVQALRAGWLQGKLLFNLDTEEWGQCYIGCAGGVDVTYKRAARFEPMPADWQAIEVALTGFRGGHSGADIHKLHGNPIRALAHLALDAIERYGARVVSMRGGTLRNALAREAFVTLALPSGAVSWLDELVGQWRDGLSVRMRQVEPNVKLVVTPVSAMQALSESCSRTSMELLVAAHHGVLRWSPDVEGVVETSANLGVVHIDAAHGFEAVSMARSLNTYGLTDIKRKLRAIGRLADAVVIESGEYPGWAPDPASPALALLKQVYQSQFGDELAVEVIHAGLECGLIAAKYPEMDMVSFGPTIRGAHSPDERVEVASVEKFWELLKAAVAAVPAA
ncbi:aminoacyl-histidine dipeptidase [Jeongeupia naejangsanensis]|uniref:Aminoacyl-histidine dipeptidase n=1 Tax=Jeongeupia naejangsanensis TaxID=613195 RepID=A0ABS2BIT4_9NEIS|nr:aminoacyl-histidine dipeptidase [Jeongeupia naejangsanensis]MBM3114739.1 aminoacyl-histidine dipeptidase [Jeongeupia naejangsanensis]